MTPMRPRIASPTSLRVPWYASPREVGDLLATSRRHSRMPQRRRFVHRLLPGLTRPAAPTFNGPGSTLASASYR